MGLFSKLFQSNEKNFVSPMTGKVVAMSDIPDPAFAQKMMGDGCGIELTDGTVVAPFDAKVTAAFPTGHAFGLEAKDLSALDLFSIASPVRSTRFSASLISRKPS